MLLPFIAPRAYPPSWVDLLRDTVLSPDRHWVSAESARIQLATRELQAWLADPRPYDGPQQKWSWSSVLADFLRSVDHLGPELTTALGSDLATAVATATSLKSDFDSKSHGQMEAALTARRSGDQVVIDQLISRWEGVDVRLTAWRDLIEACRDTTVPYGALAHRRDLFWHLTRSGDHDTGQLSDFLAGTLANNAYWVDLAKVWLGDITPHCGSRTSLPGYPRPSNLPSASGW
jgi:hypothetical protein